MDDKEQTRRSTKRKRTEITEKSIDVISKLGFQQKTELFNGLIRHGSSNISLLQPYIPSTNEDVIKKYITYYKRLCRTTVTEGQTDSSPIEKWLDYLAADANKDRERLNDLSRALKYIALFEKNDPIVSDCYEVLSDCMKGESPKHLNPVASLFLYNKIQQFIKKYKIINFDRENKCLENIDKKIACYAGKKKITIECGSSSNITIDPKISNPLKISNSLLELKK